jgi:myo-inositol-1(or 4)-monophosphatase
VTLATTDLAQLGAIAADILTECEPEFLAGLGAAEEITKGIGDYATAVDLALERRITAALLARTGIAVHGEEFGGADLTSGAVWVLDPVDGTANFSQRIPLTGTNLALLIDGEPQLGLTWLPLLDERYVAVRSGPVMRNGVALPPLEPAPMSQTVVSFGHVGLAGGRYPTGYRIALFHAVSERAMRVRIMGTSALEFAWVAAGVFSAAVSFGNKAWDTAPGDCLVHAAGGSVTDLAGLPHHLGSPSMVAARPGVAEEMLEILAAVGDPSGY